MVKKAIIPAAGLGTRMLPATKSQPKEMLPIYDKPSLQYIIEEAVASGIEEILIITGRNKHSIEDHFDRSVELEWTLEKAGKKALLEEVRRISNMCDIHYIRQKEQRGLGHAIYCAKSFIGQDPFAVLLGDDIVYSEKPCIGQLIEVYNARKSAVIGVQNVERDCVDQYGIVYGKRISPRLYAVGELVEKPDPHEAKSTLAILGRYIIPHEIFDILENTPPGKNNEIQLTDALNVLQKEQKMYAYNFIGQRYDIGDKVGLLRATVDFGLRDKKNKARVVDYLKWLEKKDYQVE